MSRKHHRRAEQTYQKTWKKKELAQPLEVRTIRSSDHNRSRGSQQQEERGTNEHKSTPAFINLRTRRKKGLGSRCHTMLLHVLYGGEQKYVRLSDLTYDAFLREVCLKFNIPEGRQQDPKVYDQSDTEVDFDVFEEIAKQSPGTFRVTLSSEEAVAALSSSSFSATSDDTIILNFTMCDPSEEATAEGSQPNRPCNINYEAQALIEKFLTTKPGGEQILQEYARTKCLTDATRRQMINILTAAMTEARTSPSKSVRVMYAQGIVALFPYLEDPFSKHVDTVVQDILHGV
ncbi:hypothetical protein ATANTOWER_025909 [Ataeniobius toweri]|uniref:PB1 domain-containing protein n=1 Tax=Ataeniobius toweri TaxID=208326 RepID=A0ABU7BUT4_9TELE|nr:hypothetical protein [Ataeniobius toweri]